MPSPAFLPPAPRPVSASPSRPSPSTSPLAPQPSPLTAPHALRPAQPSATLAAPPRTPSPPSRDESARRTPAPFVPLPGVVHDIETPQQFDALVESAARDDALLVADFMAKWCRKCLYLVPRLNKIATKNPTLYFCKIDVNAVARLPKEFNISKMPTFIYIKNGKPVHVLVGGAEAPTVARNIEKLFEKYAQK